MDFDKRNVKIKSRKRIFDGFFKIDELIVDHDCFDGSRLTNIRREAIVKYDTVSVLLYDPRLDSLLFVRQLRAPLLEREERRSPWTIEIVAGTVDRNDSHEAIITAEAFEEAGVEILKLLPIMDFYPSAGGSAGKMSLYLGLCDLEGAGGYYGLPDEGEDIEAFVVSREKGFEMLAEGGLDNSFTIIAMLWFQLNYKSYKL